MAISLGQTGTADSVDAEYFNWESADRRFLVHMHLDAMDGLARDAIENSQGLPVETGGILLGQVGRGERPVVWIERFQRIQIEHRSGPNFVLAADEYAAFERAARQFAEGGELIVVGFYRTHLRSGLQLEPPDFELASRYFRDPEDLFLLLKPVQQSGISAQFFGHDAGAVIASPPKPLGSPFPFRGRVVGVLESKPLEDDSAERTAKTVVTPMPQANPAAQRRLVPDFQPNFEPQKPREFSVTHAEPDLDAPGFFHKRWPLIAALVLVGGVGGVLWQQTLSHTSSKPAPQATASVRPLGLYVDPSGETWRVSWNQTALQGTRDLKLFVRDASDQERVISGQDLQGGTYEYQPKGFDVTFRLEAVDNSGRVSAESFRVVTKKEQTAEVKAPPAPVAAPPASPAPATGDVTPPKATHRVPPVVPASIRPRINGSTPVDIRVAVDTRGRVTSATPVTHPKNSLERYLANRAVYAARQWRFEPAKKHGKPVVGAEIIHFVFDK